VKMLLSLFYLWHYSHKAQRLGLLACLAISNVKRSFGGPCQAPPAALLSKCKLLQIARSQLGLA